MHRVLVTGLGGCGVGEGIAKALLMKGYQVFGSNNEGFFPSMTKISTSFLLPRATEAEYLPRLLGICRNHGIRAVYPGSELETKVLSEGREMLSAEGIVPMVNRPEIIATFQDSWNTYQTLKNLPFAQVPDTFLPGDMDRSPSAASFPLIIKPVFGHGSQNIHIVENVPELMFVLEKMQRKAVPVIIQKMVGSADEEYTVGVFTDREGQVISKISMKRNMIGGATLTAHIDGYAEIEEYCGRIAVAIGSKGPLNLQLRRDGDKFYIFEINPRFSGTTPFRAMVGINEPDMMYRNLILDEPLSPVGYQKGKIIMRMFQEVMIDNNDILHPSGTAS